MAKHPSTSIWTYFAVAFALLLLTGATVGVAYLELGPFNDLVAVAIALLKASLIGLFFMHLRYSTGLTRVMIFSGLLIFALLIVGVLDDYVTRDWVPVPAR